MTGKLQDMALRLLVLLVLTLSSSMFVSSLRAQDEGGEVPPPPDAGLEPIDNPEPLPEVDEPEPPMPDNQDFSSPSNGGRSSPPIGNPGKPNLAAPTRRSTGDNASPADAQTKSPEPQLPEDGVASDLVPDDQELVYINFPDPTEIKDIIRAVMLWTGKNVLLGKDVTGKVQMISPRKVTKAEAYQAFLSALNMLDLTTVETGKVIKIVKTRAALKSNLRTFYGANWTPLTDELITQIVPLKYIDANEIQRTLSRIVSTNAIIAYPTTNTLIITESGYQVRRMLDIIKHLDVQTQQPKLSIMPIRNGSAEKIAKMVQDIFASANGKKTTGGGSSYMTYKIMTDDRTNSVVIFGPPRTIADVKKLVAKFDVMVDDPSSQASIHVRPLDYADAAKLASTLTSLASGSSSATKRPPVGGNASGTGASAGNVAVLENNVKIAAEESSNSLLITGSRSAYESLNQIVRKLDTRKSQVYVEAEILDIKVEGGFQFGTSVFAGGMNGGNPTIGSWEGARQLPLIALQKTENPSSTAVLDAAKTFSEDLNIGILSGKQVDIPGFGKISPGALIKMVKTDSSTRILSSPQILTSNNEEAKFSVGRKIFFKAQESSATSGVANTVRSEKVSLSLNIKPNISHSNYVTMKIDLDASDGELSKENLPNVLERKTNQIVTVKNGQTVVISGLTKNEEMEIYKKIPLLGDIPILGWLFRNTTKQKVKSNLMIFLTPHIVHGANDLAEIYKRKISERDEILNKLYGSDFKETEFYADLPALEDGAYNADAFDVIDEKMRHKNREIMLKDMGYGTEDIDKIGTSQNDYNGPGSDVTVPVVSGSIDGTPAPRPVNEDEEEISVGAIPGSGDSGGGNLDAPEPLMAPEPDMAPPDPGFD